MILIGVKYVEHDPTTYAGAVIHHGRGQEDEIFNTGNPTLDFVTLCTVMMARGHDGYRVTSSFDHFVMDGGVMEVENIPPELLEEGKQLGIQYLLSTGEWQRVTTPDKEKN